MLHFDTNLFISVEVRCNTSLKLYIPPAMECEPQLLQVCHTTNNQYAPRKNNVRLFLHSTVLKVQFIAKVFHFVKGKIYFVALHKTEFK